MFRKVNGESADLAIAMLKRETAKQTDPLEGFPAFSAEVRQRLEDARRVYDDESFDDDPALLVAELQKEALDLAGWGFVLWTRLERMRKATERLALSEPVPPTRTLDEDEEA